MPGRSFTVWFFEDQARQIEQRAKASGILYGYENAEWRAISPIPNMRPSSMKSRLCSMKF